MDESKVDVVNVLAEQARLVEQPFVSETPVMGGLIVWFRTLWHSVAGKWALLALVQQQNAFNALLVQRIEALEAQLVAQDREGVQLTHDHAETALYVGQLKRRLAAMEARLGEMGD